MLIYNGSKETWVYALMYKAQKPIYVQTSTQLPTI